MHEEDREMGRTTRLLPPGLVQVLLPFLGPVCAFLLIVVVAW
jgi:hypothetical protein